MIVRTRTADVFEFADDTDQATFTVDIDVERKSYILSIESTYGGGYAYRWGSPGKSFYGFLARLDEGYLLSKMVGFDDTTDPQDTAVAIREAIIEGRRLHEMTREQARSEWELTEHLMGDGSVDVWMMNTEYFTEEPWQYIRTSPGRRSRELSALFKVFWPAFAIELNKRCERERLYEATREA